MVGGGTAIGGYLGGPAGAALGSSAGAFLSKITGFGDYVIRSNSLMSNRSAGHTFGDDSRSIRVMHHEYLCDITAQSDFTIERSVPINPGLPSSFTWVAQLADAFQQYKMRGCVFYYRSVSAEWSGSGIALGTVVMGTQYDVTKEDFTSKVEMENYLFSCSTKPSLDLVHPIECDNKESPVDTLYLRSGPLEASRDPKFYDFGRFQCAVVGCDASVVGQTIGELWVAYDVELLKPQYPPGGVLAGQYFSCVNASVTQTDPLGPIQTVPYGNLPLTIGPVVGAGYDGIIFPETISGGRFYVNVTWRDTASAAWTAPTLTPGTGVTPEVFTVTGNVGTRGNVPAITTTGVTTTTASVCGVFIIDGHSATGHTLGFTFGAKPINSASPDVQIDVLVLPSINLYGE